MYRIFLVNMGYYHGQEHDTFAGAVYAARDYGFECAITRGVGDAEALVATYSVLRGLDILDEAERPVLNPTRHDPTDLPERCCVCGVLGPVEPDEEFPANLLCAGCRDAVMP